MGGLVACEVAGPAEARQELLTAFRQVRAASVDMCRPLEPEDYRLQPSADVSPPWWNLGHTSWFFVRNVLAPLGGRMEPDDARYDFLLNSYYASLGPRLARSRRGSLSRPTTGEIYDYRASVDRRVEDLLQTIDGSRLAELESPLVIGLHHEQQHQELFYTEIKSILAQNPRELRRSYRATPHSVDAAPADQASAARTHDFVEFDGGLLEFGHRGPGWCWDNELPVHRYWLPGFALATRLVTNAEFLEFVDAGGYRQPLLWLDNGWSQVQEQGWQAPLYWEQVDGQWWTWTLGGMRLLALEEPVCHVSFYEADALARWKSHAFADCRGARLPSEREWEHAARTLADSAAGETADAADDDAFFESGRLHPAPAAGDAGPRQNGRGLRQMAGVLWQWTHSYYEPYPGYRPFPGALAEYNGKFMDNQRVLRGGSCVTPRDHYRVSYRNFWAAPTRFQFTGIRLARDTWTRDT